LSGGPSLTLASGPMSWQGEHKRLNTCSPPAASCASVAPLEAARAMPAITHILIAFLLLKPIRLESGRRHARPSAHLALTRNRGLQTHKSAHADLQYIAALFEWR
jgi:hypothetical protein